jgi:hypothetical protein
VLVGKESWIWTNPHCLLRFLRCAWTRLLQVPQDLGIQFHRTARPMVRTRETLSRRSRSCCYCSIRISRLAALELVRVQEDQASDAQLTSPSPFCKFFVLPSIHPASPFCEESPSNQGGRSEAVHLDSLEHVHPVALLVRPVWKI